MRATKSLFLPSTLFYLRIIFQEKSNKSVLTKVVTSLQEKVLVIILWGGSETRDAKKSVVDLPKITGKAIIP